MDRVPRSGCPIATTLDIVGDRWTLVILRDLITGKSRFSEFLASPEKITTNILTDRLASLEGSGVVMRGRFTETAQANGENKCSTQWCERRLLARIHRLTLDGLRQKIQPVAPEVYLDYLTRQHGLHPAQLSRGVPHNANQILAPVRRYAHRRHERNRDRARRRRARLGFLRPGLPRCRRRTLERNSPSRKSTCSRDGSSKGANTPVIGPT